MSRRVSVLRLGAAFALIGGIGFAAGRTVPRLIDPAHPSKAHWFAPYVDVTLPPSLDFQDPTVNPSKDVVLAFVVADPGHACTPSWGGAYGLRQAASTLDLDRRIVRLREQGGDAIVSFGGVANQELGHACTDPAKLAAAYRQVVDRYDLRAIDLDLEGASLDDVAGLARRATAIKAVQDERTKAGKRLDVWLTLPVAPTGLAADGVAAVDAMLAAEVRLAGVNVMTMDYGGSRPADQSFVSASVAALDASATQVRTAYRRAGVRLSREQSYAKLGMTPMIGQNDVTDDVLSTKDARRLFDQATGRGVRRISMWSLNRDQPCGANVAASVADNRCSGVDQEPLEFSRIFDAVGGRATPADDRAGADADADQPSREGWQPASVDDPAHAPYAYWRPRREYDLGTKVVWRGEVYEAKWWNVGSQPDAPVAHEWDSPWRVVGPVLPTDAPPAGPPTLPAGTYPEWKATTAYLPGQRVEELGVGYRAKWWTQGEDPSADVDNDWQTPWEVVGAPTKPKPATTTTAPATTTTTTTTTPPAKP